MFEQTPANHWKSIRDKFQGRKHGIIANLNQTQITLIPFSTDPHGGLGHFADRLTCEPPQNKPPWRQPIDFTSEAAFQAHTKAMTSPHSFLTTTNSKCDAVTPFGHTHITRTPEQWATQTLGLNFVTSSDQFLLHTRHSRNNAIAYQSRSRDPQIHPTPSWCKPGLLPPTANTSL